MKKKVLFIAVATLIFWACSSDGDNSDPDPIDPIEFDRKAMLVNITDNIIIPAYQDFDLKIDAFKVSFEAFSTNPTVTALNTVREGWFTAYKTWQHVSMFEIGPAETLDFRLNMNIYPADDEKIEGYISSGDYNLALASNRDAKGFPALDYLFYGLADTDEAIIEVYAGEDGSKYLAYVAALLNDMETMTETVLSEWENGYGATFVANDGASATASVDRFVNDYIFYFEKFLRAGKMGIPLGVFSGTPSVGHLEAFYSDGNSKTLFLEGLLAVQNLFNGQYYGTQGEGPGLASYLDVLNSVKDGEDLAQAINDQINVARTAVQALGNFKDEIVNNTPPENMLNAYDEVQRIVPLLKVDMVSAMNIHIDFVDADGD
ncbi:imelysin family protein [uncultured Kriegella sp.]|uniref:imelysin family protein n=1 Tax=uncultured Kriegella sp. TaxID=1798910 RepID=UPI0030D9509A|tara:strand:+ start:118683 stop:119807 length:1125 start_codon:yes stop_codon:yes gene_type:complete